MISLENKNRLVYGIIFVCILWLGTSFSALSCSILFAIIGFICLYEMWQLRIGKPKILALLYILTPFILIQIIIWNLLDFPAIWVSDGILNILITTWTFDSFAYIIGIKFGKNKIMPSISPKKSWEGFFGGMIVTIILAFLYSLYKEQSYIGYILMAIIIPFLATIGDFIESAYKREAGVKDSGNLIPGHGGMLDRMDSLLISISLLSLYYYYPILFS
tara:strand:+ start:25 stop:678 length:654 start_codon:yes stop_codon:yes gene_type:complete